jgi:uncharacterized protein (TIGR02246 family)
MRNVLSAVAAVLVFIGAPAFAQQKSSADDRAMERAKALEKAVIAAWNSKDPAKVAALDTPNAVLVAPDGKVYKGRAAIEAYYVNLFKAFGDFKFTYTAQAAGPIGNGFWAMFDSTAESKGPNGPISRPSHVMGVFVPQGKEWKFAAISVGANVSPPGAPPAR